ncbi:hypothetical protein BDR22DRAFT_857869 [Usnea florida]
MWGVVLCWCWFAWLDEVHGLRYGKDVLGLGFMVGLVCRWDSSSLSLLIGTARLHYGCVRLAYNFASRLYHACTVQHFVLSLRLSRFGSALQFFGVHGFLDEKLILASGNDRLVPSWMLKGLEGF